MSHCPHCGEDLDPEQSELAPPEPAIAVYATDVDPQNPEYTMVPCDTKAGRIGIWIRLSDVTGADDELDQGEKGARDGETFVNTIHLPIA